MYPVELEIKETTKSTTSGSYLDLRLSIERDGQLHTPFDDKRDDFNFHITNFPSLSCNIHQLRPPMVTLSHNFNYVPGLSPRMNVLFWRLYDLQISFSNRDMSRNAWKKFDGHSGSYQIIQSSSLMKAKWHSVAWPNTMTTPYRSDFIPIRDLFTDLDLLPTYERFP